MKYMMLLFFLVVFVIALVFSILNMHPVKVHFYYGSVTMPFALILTMELLAGVAIGIAACVMHIFKLKAQCLKLKKRLSTTERELQNLKNRP